MRHRSRPAPVPGLRQRPPVLEARPVRRLYRLLELSRMPLHARLRSRGRGRDRRRRHGARQRPGQRPERQPEEGSLRPLPPARRGGERQQAEAGRAAARAEARRCHSRHGAAPAGTAARDRPPPRNRRADHRRDRPVRRLSQARRLVYLARRRRRRADDRPQPGGDAAGRGQDAADGAGRNCCASSAPTRRAARSGLYRGRYGPYVSHDGIIASLPKGADPDSFALDAAVALLAAQRAKGKTRRPARKAPARKATPASSGNGAAKRATAAKPRAKAKPPANAAAKKPARRRPA